MQSLSEICSQTDRQTDTYSVPHMHIGMLIAILCSTTTPGAE